MWPDVSAAHLGCVLVNCFVVLLSRAHLIKVGCIWMWYCSVWVEAHFLKRVINFVQSNDIKCEFCGDQSNVILLLLYYCDCVNRSMAGYGIKCEM